MHEGIEVTINERKLHVPEGCTVAAAIAIAGAACRSSVLGQKRGPLCGMGICFECRATVNGWLHTRTCMLICEHAMDIRTS